VTGARDQIRKKSHKKSEIVPRGTLLLWYCLSQPSDPLDDAVPKRNTKGNCNGKSKNNDKNKRNRSPKGDCNGKSKRKVLLLRLRRRLRMTTLKKQSKSNTKSNTNINGNCTARYRRPF